MGEVLGGRMLQYIQNLLPEFPRFLIGGVVQQTFAPRPCFFHIAVHFDNISCGAVWVQLCWVFVNRLSLIHPCIVLGYLCILLSQSFMVCYIRSCTINLTSFSLAQVIHRVELVKVGGAAMIGLQETDFFALTFCIIEKLF